jgi:hypothetical protein
MFREVDIKLGLSRQLDKVLGDPFGTMRVQRKRPMNRN